MKIWDGHVIQLLLHLILHVYHVNQLNALVEILKWDLTVYVNTLNPIPEIATSLVSIAEFILHLLLNAIVVKMMATNSRSHDIAREPRRLHMNFPISKILENNTDFLSDNNCFGFFDWFCNDSALERRAKSLFNNFKKIANSPKINKDTMYLWFKNNCPCIGNLYDDFRISDLSTGNVIFTVTPSSSHNETAEVWGKENNFKSPLITGTYQDIITWFNS
jgi:hypothetical protein